RDRGQSGKIRIAFRHSWVSHPSSARVRKPRPHLGDTPLTLDLCRPHSPSVSPLTTTSPPFTHSSRPPCAAFRPTTTLPPKSKAHSALSSVSTPSSSATRRTSSPKRPHKTHPLPAADGP